MTDSRIKREEKPSQRFVRILALSDLKLEPKERWLNQNNTPCEIKFIDVDKAQDKVK